MKTSAIVCVLAATVLAVSVLAGLLWNAPGAPAVKAAAPAVPCVLFTRADAFEIALAAQSAGISANPVKIGNGLYTRLAGRGFAHGAVYGQPGLLMM